MFHKIFYYEHRRASKEDCGYGVGYDDRLKRLGYTEIL